MKKLKEKKSAKYFYILIFLIAVVVVIDISALFFEVDSIPQRMLYTVMHTALIVTLVLAYRNVCLLQKRNEKLKELSYTDGLTGIPNRRFFDVYYTETWKEMAEENQPLTIMILDLDYFKSYNDTYGHLAGDDCLKTVARTLEAAIDYPGMVFRFGGEEFVIILPRTSYADGQKMAEELKNNINKLGIVHENSLKSPYLTASHGLASATPYNEEEAKDLLQLADDMLYEVKRGRTDLVNSQAVQ
ncbi:GGDEF domain-containing protein [Peribacillus saganii]|nr:GGDEF domain-containing protein [Peribacillus saganii]